MLKELFENVKIRRPLIHNITNYVTANDCANILLACGASPIMADDIGEAEEITSLCDGLNLNMGTLNQRIIPSMAVCGKRANQLKHPVVLDPVGAGASALRTATAASLISQIQFSVIKGNISEIKTLALGSNSTKGVDANTIDTITQDHLEETIAFAKAFSQKTNAVIVITGPVDIVADAGNAYAIYNGHPMMSRVTGTGCQLSALTAAFVSANPDRRLEAAAAAVCLMGICGEMAQKRLSDLDGNATYRNYIIDSVSRMDGDTFDCQAKYKRF